MSSNNWQFWIDRGGTFTDIVALRPDGGIETAKLLSEDPEHYTDAAAEGIRRLAAETLAAITEGRTPKGDVFATARIAGIQAAKRTDQWIPLCHQLPLESIEILLTADKELPGVRVEAVVRAHAQTGVEMEALIAVTAAGLTIYDMCKAIDRGMTVSDVRLVRKQGGKSGLWEREGEREI